MVGLALEILETGERRPVVLGSEANAWDEPAGPDRSSVGALDEPLMSPLIEMCAFHVLVVFDVGIGIPLLLHVFEVPTELGPARVSLLEGEVVEQFLVK